MVIKTNKALFLGFSKLCAGFYFVLPFLVQEPRKQLSNHLEEDIQLLINFESNFKFKNKLVKNLNNS